MAPPVTPRGRRRLAVSFDPLGIAKVTLRRVTNTGETRPTMRILLGTATCSAAPAPTSTRGRSRVSGAGPGHDVVVVSQEANPELYDLGGAQTVRPDVGGLLPVFVLDRYEGMRGEAAPGHDAGGARPFRRGQRRRAARARAGRPRLRQPRAARRAGRRGLGPALRRQGPRLRARVLDARQRGARARGGSETLAGARRSSSARRTSGRCSRTSSATSTGLRGSPGVDVDEFRPRDRGQGARRPDRGVPAATRRTPATRTSGSPTREMPSGSRVPRGGAPTVLYFGKLIQTRACTSCSRRSSGLDARAVIVGFGDYRAELEATAGPHVLFTGPLEHRHLVHLIPLADVDASSRRSSRKPSGWSPPKPPPAVRCRSSPGTRAWRRSRTRSRTRASRARSSRATSTTWSTSSNRSSGDPNRSARSSGAAPAASSSNGGRGRPWRTRLLQPFT